MRVGHYALRAATVLFLAVSAHAQVGKLISPVQYAYFGDCSGDTRLKKIRSLKSAFLLLGTEIVPFDYVEYFFAFWSFSGYVCNASSATVRRP